jgi:hypothetical protein
MKERIENRGCGIDKGQRLARAILYPLSSILLCTALVGCNIANAVAYKVSGPPAVEAKYVPAQEPMLVLVENYRTTGAYSDSEVLARHLMLEFTEHKIAPLVPLEDLYTLKTNKGDAYRKMSIASVGRETGAKQVLYVDVKDSSIGATSGSELMKGRINVQVRIVDVDSGATRWPTEAAEGIPMGYETPLPRADENTTEAIIRNRMYANMANRIGRLFYKWKPDETGEELDMGQQ